MIHKQHRAWSLRGYKTSPHQQVSRDRRRGVSVSLSMRTAKRGASSTVGVSDAVNSREATPSTSSEEMDQHHCQAGNPANCATNCANISLVSSSSAWVCGPEKRSVEWELLSSSSEWPRRPSDEAELLPPYVHVKIRARLCSLLRLSSVLRALSE